MLALELAKRRGHDVVNGGALQLVDQKTLQSRNVLRGRAWTEPRADEIPKRRDPAETDPAIHERIRGNRAQHVRHARTQPYSDERGRRVEPTLIRPQQGTTQRPFGWPPLLQLNGDRRGAVWHHANDGVSFRRDHPEASDIGTQCVGCFLEPNVHAMHQSAADTHPLESSSCSSGIASSFQTRFHVLSQVMSYQ